MRIMVRARAGGKTHTMLQALISNPNALLVTHSETEATRLRRELDRMEDLEHPPYARIVSAEKSRDWLRGRNQPPVDLLVDNLDLVLGNYLGAMPIEATMTNHVTVDTPKPKRNIINYEVGDEPY